MASAEAALFSLLTTGSPNAVAAIVGTRVWPDILPQAPVLPAIRYQRISTPRSQYRTLDGKAEYASPRFQVDCYALSRSAAIALADAVYRLLEGFAGIVANMRIDRVSTDDEGADIEEGVAVGGGPVYRQRLDFFIAHPESGGWEPPQLAVAPSAGELVFNGFAPTGAWTPFLDGEYIVKAFMQEDIVATGSGTSWTSRGVSPVTATGAYTKLAANGGVRFVEGTTNRVSWPVDTRTPRLHRWWLVIAKSNWTGGHSILPILNVHSASGGSGTPYRQPYIYFDTNNTMKDWIIDASGDSTFSQAADTNPANWNILLGFYRGWQHRAWINGVEKSPPLAFKGMIKPNHSLAGWIGAGQGAPGSPSLTADVIVDCVIIGQAEPTDDWFAKLLGWAHWRASRADLLPVGHPYKAAAPPADESEGTAPRYAHSASAWATYKATSDDKTRLGDAAPAADATYKRVFFTDFTVSTDRPADDRSGVATSPWFAPGWNEAAGADSTLLRPAETPDCYVIDTTGIGTLKLMLQETAPSSGLWRSGAMYTINYNGKGRWWGKSRRIARIRFNNFGSPPRPGFFPAMWGYGRDHLYWNTRNRIEADWFEHEGGNVADSRIAQAVHVHEPFIAYSSPDVLASGDNAGVISSNSLTFANGWPVADFAAYTDWHVYEERLEDDMLYNFIDDIEVGRRVPASEWLHPRYSIFTNAYRSFQGTAVAGQVYEMEIDYYAVWMKEADLAVVPGGFSGRPTLSGTRGLGNTITCTPNTTAAQIEYRWYYDGGRPIIGAEAATFVETATTVGTPLRVHVRAVSLLGQPEAWTAELAA